MVNVHRSEASATGVLNAAWQRKQPAHFGEMRKQIGGNRVPSGNAIALLYLAKYEMNQPVIGVKIFCLQFSAKAPDIWGRRGEGGAGGLQRR
ncbi:hypothetical protein CEXT_729341 [Caerostris extrusa]|uniref:Uncharacterized protein n=1 Tax=Caerostris extrusa TaxID=172846 RepID=A0AAV4PRH6_CAEEX|nr:hypothetical protein CEXT_729341 [Caerostris extrusa]